jgi:two-component system LytT family sensor kinase
VDDSLPPTTEASRTLIPAGTPGAVVLVALWSIPGILASAETSIFQMLEGRHLPFARVLLQQCSAWWAWAAMTPVVFMLAERWPLRRPFRAGTLAVHVLGSLVATVVHGVVYTLASLVLAPTPASTSLSLLLFRSLVGWLPITVPIYFGLVAVAHWLTLARREREREQRTLALEAQLAGAQLQALRMQLHPHFLFNTLNTIAMLVREQDVTASVRLITQLGDVLRQVLRSADTQEVLLAEELAFTKSYLAIEEVRFADRLRIRWAVDASVMDALVPHLILQPLVENAFRHGIARREGSGLLEIGATRAGQQLRLWVRDDGPGLASTYAASDGIGIANVRARLAALYRTDASLTLDSLALDDGGGVRATLSLPWREGAREATDASAELAPAHG